MHNTLGIRNFQTNAFVIVETEQADNFYIIRQGQINLTHEIPIPNESPNHTLNPGNFFGVVSCMSGHPHIETARALSNISCIVVARSQFGTLIQKNAPIAMKIIRYFSQRLRIISNAITNLSNINLEIIHPELIFDLAEYYFNNKQPSLANYGYRRYVELFPAGTHVSDAQQRIQALNLPPVASRNDHNLNVSYQDGDPIFLEYEPGAELYIIQTGKVKIKKLVNQQETLLAVLQPGDIFGEMSLLEDKPRSASAIAYGPVSCLAINKANFENMVRNQLQLAIKIITLLSQRIWTSYRQLSNLLIEDPVGRIYDLLLTLVQKNNVPIKSKEKYNFNIGVKDISQMLSFKEDEGEQYISEILENNNLRLEAGLLECFNLMELEKQVQFYRKKAAMEKKREMSKLAQSKS